MPIGYNHPEARQTSKQLLQIWNTCWRCGAANRLSVHHDDRNRRNNKNGNIYVICASCHGKIHAKDPRLGKDRFKVNYSLFSVTEWQKMTIAAPESKLDQTVDCEQCCIVGKAKASKIIGQSNQDSIDNQLSLF